MLRRWVFDSPGWVKGTKRNQTSLPSLGGWQCSGMGHQNSLFTTLGALSLKAVFSKAVSGIRDYPSSTGDSDLKSTPGLLEDWGGKYVDICGGSWRGEVNGGEMGKVPRREDRFYGLKAEQELKAASRKREQDSGLYGRKHCVLRPPGNLALFRVTMWSAEELWYRSLYYSEGLCRCW